MRVGDKIETWFSGSEDGMSTILEIRPYTGHFHRFYTHIVKVTALNTRWGWMEMAVDTR